MKPSLAVFMICKNEEAHIGKALESIAPIAGTAIIVDTGSTDRTREVALSYGRSLGVHVQWGEYFDASEKDEAGDWKLWDFAAARNRAADWAEQHQTSHVMWLDADDVVVNPERIARALYRDDADVFAMTVESGGMRWLHHRMWRTDKHVRFRGRCHEYPVIDGLRAAVLDVTIRHDAAPVEGQENANARNLRMLMREWKERPDDPRTAFYIAQTHKDGGRHKEAAEWYQRRIAMGEHYRDEWLFSHLYLGREYLALNKLNNARLIFEVGDSYAPNWMEFSADLARLHLRNGKQAKAEAWALEAFDAPIPPTELWREVNAYTDQPCRILSFCYEAQGDIGKACAWARMALDRIGVPDKEWQARVATLEAQLVKPEAPAIVTRRKERIAIVRPGAIGDVLMTLNLLPAFKGANPDAEIHYYTKVEGLDDIIVAAGAKPIYMGVAWERDACTYDRTINLVGYPLAEGYPEKPMLLHLLQYFAQELGLRWDEPVFPSLELPLPKQQNQMVAGREYITIQSEAGWSKYKEWNEDKWSKVCDALKPTPIFDISAGAYSGAPLSYGIALLANARIHLGIDSFANHLTNYFWRDGRSARRVPGVILWGSTQWQAAGYPHNINISKGLYCQPCFRENDKISKMPRGPCVNPLRPTYDDDTPWRCMEEISVDEVVEAALKLWEQAGRETNPRNEPASALRDMAPDDSSLP